MTAMSDHTLPEVQEVDYSAPHPMSSLAQDLRHAKREIELLKTIDPLRAAEMALEIQVERMRVGEAMSARDAVVQRLADAYVSIRQKTATIERLQHEQECLRKLDALSMGSGGGDTGGERQRLKDEILRLEGIIKDLRAEIKILKSAGISAKSSGDPPPSYDEEQKADSSKPFQNDIDHAAIGNSTRLLGPDVSRVPFRVLRETPPLSRTNSPSATSITAECRAVFGDTNDLDNKAIRTPVTVKDPEDMAKARNAVLSALPLPVEIPEDALKPILIPAPFTLHEFLGNASGSLRNSLSNYRVFQQLTTAWCPEREEHGYLLTPAFKCSTNPRVATAHRWTSVDVIAKMGKPTECFYNKDGKWYYAGVYKAFRLDDLTTKEWEALSNETTQSIIKDTISGRKNTSPQNMYETAQLYAAGALKVACVGLQCVGFNNLMYRAILEQANKCAVSGKWKGAAVGGGAGGVWNSGAGDADRPNRNADGDENVPAGGEPNLKR